ncbi:Transcription elongation factor, TFIIS/CRSP70 [Artemisia annua]|uniref:Transcription elongation factor, TFIIS/CRSP70 n=1 Tax=Artemisia annua TaxID=35608 RepID=A0A2U1LPR1_ARTAN|nr:Transcription elongation factor, TFIIS/CRSP70 [Artemisia annua]
MLYRYPFDLINRNKLQCIDARTTENKDDEENKEWRHDVAANEDISVVDQEEQKQDMPTSKPQRSLKVRITLKKAETYSEKDSVAKGPITPDLKVEHSTNLIDEVLRIKGVIDKAIEDELVLCDSLKKLQNMEISMETLEKTGIGKTVSLLRKHVSKEVSKTAWKLVKAWKDMVDKSLKNKSSIAKPVSERAKNQQSSVTCDQRCKPMDSDVKTGDQKGPTSTIIEKKLEASKRKLHRSYEEVECMKKKRKIQVLQLHELPPQNHHIKPVNKQLKRCTNMRC